MKPDTFEKANQLQQKIKTLRDIHIHISKMKTRDKDDEFNHLRQTAYNLASALILQAERDFELL